MRPLAIVLILITFTTRARADCTDLDTSPDPCPWYRGPSANRRITHMAITVAAAALYATSQALESHIAPVDCLWCSVDSLDARVRSSLAWSNPGPARTLSNITGYGAAPVAALGLTLAGTLTAGSTTSATRVIDDVLPILETAALGEAVAQTVKFVAGRQRPFVHYGAAAPHDPEDNVSFFSAHTTLVFGLATSAGVVAHHRGYKTEPYIWSLGFAIAATTAYLRLAGDEHYFTDVVTGAAVGIAAGVTVPLLSRPEVHPVLVPGGAGVAGSW